MNRTYVIYLVESGTPKAGLVLDWLGLYKVSDGTDLLTSAPAFVELGTGLYKFVWDVEANGQCAGVIDGDSDTAAGLNASDRYVPIELDPGDVGSDLARKGLKNRKRLLKDGTSWYLVIYDDDDITELVRKELTDKDSLDINDLLVGRLAIEEQSSV